MFGSTDAGLVKSVTLRHSVTEETESMPATAQSGNATAALPAAVTVSVGKK